MKYELHRQKLFIPSLFYFAHGEMYCARSWMKYVDFMEMGCVCTTQQHHGLEEIVKLVYYRIAGNIGGH